MQSSSTQPTSVGLTIRLSPSGVRVFFLATNQAEEYFLRSLLAELRPILDRHREAQR